ncbi:hypothetical protein HNP55_001424 [Paucibacter oligotrophus]|uniref:Parallel beta helix pectate lyase-like protein n=1 Tax=Roseateles oligotrophus TaxID=1769250 RepID=A0A840L9V9_9BURK|nr:DUF6519 domain-containing protein [Roseateles oligotrophus]MBB4842909.1 hypothetical protein [Roseateles oligotrophus]
MSTDLSRVRFDPLLDFAGLNLKQGAVLLDGDANELVALLDRRLRALASDILGPATVSSTTPLAFKITAVAGGLQIAKGRLYVDGLLAENHGAPSLLAAQRLFDPLLAEPQYADPLSYANQPYWPRPAPLPTAGRHLVYLDVWQRELTHLQRPELVEIALGVETSSRQQTVWQVRVLPEDAGGSTCATPDATLPGWSALSAPSSGRLSTGSYEVAPADNPCELPPTGGYRGLENQLYRVEVHEAGQPGTASFKWSRENASVGSGVASVVSATVLELDTLGRDELLRFNSGDWVEITDDWRELDQRPGELRRITVDDATRRLSFAPALPADLLPPTLPDSTQAHERHLRVRRWDQAGKVFRTDASGVPVQVHDLDAATATGAIPVPASGVQLMLEHGITVEFSVSDPSGRGFKSGDYWVFAARTADASVEILDRAPPRGIHHHYARLGLWDVGAASVSDCRHPWPPETQGGDCMCTACVTPESHASGRLTLQAAVDRVMSSGGTVCLHEGDYTLNEPVRIAGARSLRIHGQGPASRLITAGSAFVIEGSAAIAIEDLSLLSLARAPAIAVRTVLGLRLQRLLLLVLANSDFRAPAIALSGLVAATEISHNLILAPTGIQALEPNTEGAPRALISAGLRICDNLMSCSTAGLRLSGAVAHLLDSSISGNQVLNCHEVGLAAEGLSAAGASLRLCDNHLNVHGSGIRCATDGAWISQNKLRASRDGERVLAGAGIELALGLDKTGSDQAQVLANQISGFAEAGILITAPVSALLIKLNLIDHCGNGILMREGASARALVIENNQISAIDAVAGASADDKERMLLGIGLQRSEQVTVAGNSLRAIGLQAGQDKQLVAGIYGFDVAQPRLLHNVVSDVGPQDEAASGFAGALIGLALRSPYEQAEVQGNQVEREQQSSEAESRLGCVALLLGDPSLGDNGGFNLIGRQRAFKLDERRSLVMVGGRAFIRQARKLVGDAALLAGEGARASVLGNALNARGRTSAVLIAAAGELLFSDNRCELRANNSAVVVLLDTPVALVNANRVRGGEVSIRVPDAKAQVAALGNITTRSIQAPLKPEMQVLNLIA